MLFPESNSPGTLAGAAICDKRRNIAFAETQFPGVDFSHIERGEDLVYEQHKVESEHAVMERGARFLQWIMARSAYVLCLPQSFCPSAGNFSSRASLLPATMWLRVIISPGVCLSEACHP
jgi:hypothetical protein